MLLSDVDITRALQTGEIKLEPWFQDCVQPASVDVHLAPCFRVFDTGRTGVVDPKTESIMVSVTAGEEGFVLPPGGFALGETVECVGLGERVAARLEGKSSLGRLGLMTHVTAGFIDPGFEGTITLELCNVSPFPVRLYPGMRIGQLCFYRLETPCSVPYGSPGLGSRYQGQVEPTVSRSWQGFDTVPVA